MYLSVDLVRIHSFHRKFGFPGVHCQKMNNSIGVQPLWQKQNFQQGLQRKEIVESATDARPKRYDKYSLFGGTIDTLVRPRTGFCQVSLLPSLS